jgi:hypothetical protein
VSLFLHGADVSASATSSLVSLQSQADDGGSNGEEWHFHVWDGVGIFVVDEQVRSC